MHEQPPIRLVPRGRYWGILGKMMTCYALACFTSILGGAIVLFGLWYLFASLRHAPVQITLVKQDAQVLLASLSGAAMVFGGRKLFAKAQATEPVAPLTPQNAHLLPPRESLVRASVLPPQGRPRELLRAAPKERDTPQEELLRATQAPR